MNFRIRYYLLPAVLSVIAQTNIVYTQTPKDSVAGNLIQFNDNGLWCWYQDERAVVDSINGQIIIASAAFRGGMGGQSRNGADDAVIFNLQTGTSIRYVLNQWSGNPDDHNSAGLLVAPDGDYVAMYDQHYDNFVTRYRIFNGSMWTPEQTYDWRTKPGGIDYTLAYNNIYYLSAEGRMYDFQRANHRTPNFLVSSDYGDTWSWGGQLTTNYSNSYNKGYYKYWGNGVDRIDFIFTEQHPRDTTTSIYHGYITGGKSYKSDGTLVDNNIFDTTYIPTFLDFTKVFQEGTVMGGITMRKCWNVDVMRYGNGTIAAIITTRSNDNTYQNDNGINPDHNFIYCRYDGAGWSAAYLGKAGKKLYSSEADYTGLGALCPNDPNTLYISTPYSPVDTNRSLGVREIWKGVTSNNGNTWSWTPITQNSVRDNLRPIVPVWDKDNTALLWCRGTYSSAQAFDAAVVGILDRKLETVDKKTYVDADTLNTTMANGSSLVHTGPGTGSGANDGIWHIRTGTGNGNTILTSSELTGAGENAPLIKTHIDLPGGGTYDVWVNFWGYPAPGANWRVKAALSIDSMQTFRQIACKQVEALDYDTPPLLTGSGGSYLYQAYIGRVSGVRSFYAFINDSATAIMSSGYYVLRGDSNRTWYDGISYAEVNPVPQSVADINLFPDEYKLNQNYPNPFNPTTNISFYISSSSNVNLAVYDVLGRRVATLVDGDIGSGSHNVNWNASSVASGVYFARFVVTDNLGNSKYSKINKMLFVK